MDYYPNDYNLDEWLHNLDERRRSVGNEIRSMYPISLDEYVSNVLTVFNYAYVVERLVESRPKLFELLTRVEGHVFVDAETVAFSNQAICGLFTSMCNYMHDDGIEISTHDIDELFISIIEELYSTTEGQRTKDAAMILLQCLCHTSESLIGLLDEWHNRISEDNQNQWWWLVDTVISRIVTIATALIYLKKLFNNPGKWKKWVAELSASADDIDKNSYNINIIREPVWIKIVDTIKSQNTWYSSILAYQLNLTKKEVYTILKCFGFAYDNRLKVWVKK